jgi:hypothetical protein
MALTTILLSTAAIGLVSLVVDVLLQPRTAKPQEPNTAVTVLFDYHQAA